MSDSHGLCQLLEVDLLIDIEFRSSMLLLIFTSRIKLSAMEVRPRLLQTDIVMFSCQLSRRKLNMTLET